MGNAFVKQRNDNYIIKFWDLNLPWEAGWVSHKYPAYTVTYKSHEASLLQGWQDLVKNAQIARGNWQEEQPISPEITGKPKMNTGVRSTPRPTNPWYEERQQSAYGQESIKLKMMLTCSTKQVNRDLHGQLKLSKVDSKLRLDWTKIRAMCHSSLEWLWVQFRTLQLGIHSICF